MTDLIYPRLSTASALVRFKEIVEAHATGSTTQLVAVDHPAAAPAATGGHRASLAVMADAAEAVRAAAREARGGRPQIPRHRIGAWDRAVGKALYDSLRISPADAGHEGPWNFITLVLLPDVAAERFANLSQERMLGSPRNVFRRVWVRHAVVGDLIADHSNPLSEDELVGLFERSALARNRPLIRALTAHIQDTTTADRMTYSRELLKLVRYSTGSRLLDVLSDRQISDLIEECAVQVRGEGLEGATGATPRWSGAR